MPKKILLVDDQDDILEVLQVYIEGFFGDVETICANGGHEACDILAEEEIDSIICDYRMPEGDGEVVFKCNNEKYQLPFAWHSATFTSDVQGKEELSNSNTFILSKPVSEDELISNLKVMIDSSKSESTYRKIRVSTLRKVDTSKIKVFIKLGESKYIPLNNDDTIPDSRLIELETKGEDFLYVFEDDIKNIAKNFLEVLEKKIDETQSIEEVYFVTSEIVSEVNKFFTEIGVDPEALKVAQKCATACLKNLNKSKILRELMSGKIDKENYISSHSLLTIQFASLMTNEEDTLLKLGQISIIHDLMLANERLGKIHNTKDSAFGKLSVKEKEIILNHGKDIVEKIDESIVDRDVKDIIANHHKYLNEDSWISNATTLEFIFFVAHELAHLCCVSDTQTAIAWLKESNERFKDSSVSELYRSILNQINN